MHVCNFVTSGNLLPIGKQLARAIVTSTLDLPSFSSFPPPPPPLLLLPIPSYNSLPHNLSLPCLHILMENLPFLPSYNPSCSSLSPFLPHLSHLQDFVTKYSETNLQFSDSNVNFVRHQILEYAREILEKSRENKLTKEQFILLSENLEQGIVEVRTRFSWK